MPLITHTLKIAPNAYWAVHNGEKTFEVRRNDRFFQTGDLLELEYYPYTYGSGAKQPNLTRRIGWMLTGGQYGLVAGYVAFSLEDHQTDDGGLSKPALAKIHRLLDQVARIKKVFGNNPSLGPRATHELQSLSFAAKTVDEVLTQGDTK